MNHFFPRDRLALAFACLAWGMAVLVAAADSVRPNVLFIAIDDLRPELGCYGCDAIHTPNLDRLAGRGVMFQRAYCNIPVCGASRASLMTGIRPTRGRFRTWDCFAEKDAPGLRPLNAHFLDHGYHTVTNGKVFHQPGDCQPGWSEPDWRPTASSIGYQRPENQRLHAERLKQGKRGPATEAATAPIDRYSDGEVVQKTIADLRRLARGGQPFFLAAGFSKPHLPFVAPQQFWDLYDRSTIHLPKTYAGPPAGVPAAAVHTFGELRAYSDIPATGPVSDEMAITLIHGYYASVSFIDSLVGTLLAELDELGLAGNTIVVVWGDHGWNLGDHGLWCKHCCFETSMRVPLIVAGPGVVRGGVTDGLTELVDLYPTLCDLAGLPAPPHLAGTSVAPLLEDPKQPWRPAAVGRYDKGETIRTATHRYSEYRDAKGRLLGHMLYDHTVDPLETITLPAPAAGTPLWRELVDPLATKRRGE